MRSMTSLFFGLILGWNIGCDSGQSGQGQPANVGQPASTGQPPKSGDYIHAEDATGVWNQSQVEQVTREEGKFTTLNLQNAGGGNYTGTGTREDGREYNLDIKQKPGGIRIIWTNGQGSEGEYVFGTMTDE